MIASAECVSGAVDSQNAAIHDGIPAAPGSVHLQDEPNSPVVRGQVGHKSHQTRIPTTEHSTKPHINGTISGS